MIEGRHVTAVVIGRAGSKGLPGKNARSLAGRPMICHTIEDALNSELVDGILVSTDGEAIAAAARSMDVDVIARPSDLASDSATVDSAVRHAIETRGDDASIVVILYANVPVRPGDLIDRAIQKLVATGSDSVQSYCEVGKHHPYWMMWIDELDRVHQYIPNSVYRRQDLPRLLLPDGGVIVVTRESLFRVEPEKPHAFLGEDRAAIIAPSGTVIDVDGESDARVAEAVLLQQHRAIPA